MKANLEQWIGFVKFLKTEKNNKQLFAHVFPVTTLISELFFYQLNWKRLRDPFSYQSTFGEAKRTDKMNALIGGETVWYIMS